MQVRAFGTLALLLSVGFAGCAKEQDGPTAEELAYMITRERGAIHGIVLDRNNRTMNELNVKLYRTNANDLAAEVETGFNGKFYFQRLFPTQYRISVDLKDWPDCVVYVYPNKFTNITFSQPVYPSKPKSC